MGWEADGLLLVGHTEEQTAFSVADPEPGERGKSESGAITHQKGAMEGQGPDGRNEEAPLWLLRRAPGGLSPIYVAAALHAVAT